MARLGWQCKLQIHYGLGEWDILNNVDDNGVDLRETVPDYDVWVVGKRYQLADSGIPTYPWGERMLSAAYLAN